MTTPTASDAQLIERLRAHQSGYFSHSANYATVAQAIARLRSLTTQPPSLPSNAEEWVLLSERKPTKEDANTFGHVLMLDREGLQLCCDWRFYNGDKTHWRRLPAPPAPAVLTPEEKQAAEDEKALRAECDRSGLCYEVLAPPVRHFFLAGRQSLREGGV